MNLYKKCTAKSYSFLVIVTTLASDNFSPFRKNFLEIIQKLIKIIDDEVRYERLQYDINIEAVKISTLLSGKIAKYKCLTGVLPSNQSRIIKEAKLTYSPLGKVFQKQIKTIEDQGSK